MDSSICRTCGVQYAATPAPPENCLICQDERQYVGLQGQQWTTLQEVRGSHGNVLKSEEPHVTSVHTQPKFAIGQRAFLIETPAGNILWDCVTLLDQATLHFVRQRGGLSALAISHPHYYASMIDWSHAFGNIPIYVHAADRSWVMRPDPAIVFWEGERRALGNDLMLIRCGGHFAGGAVLHWAAGADGQGVLFSGDILQVVPDRRYVSFMYSYPNYIPLNAAAVHRIAQAVEPFDFERIYGAFPEMTVATEGKKAVARSAVRYVNAIGG